MSRRAIGFDSYFKGQAKTQIDSKQGKVVCIIPNTETQEELKMSKIERVMDMFGAAIIGLVAALIIMAIIAQVAIWQGWL